MVADRFGEGDSALARYATLFDSVEINSTFHRPHQPKTFERWTASVPADFRFALKLPKTTTHGARLVECADAVAAFAEQIAPLGDKIGPLLVQLPPSLAFDASVAGAFFAGMRRRFGDRPIVCEPRHASWFASDAEQLLVDHRVARVAADPAPASGAERPGGWSGLRYIRLHGSPRIYRSSYDDATLDRIAEEAMAERVDRWIVFDNTASNAAMINALDLRDRVLRVS